MESVHWFVCLFPGQIQHSLSQANSYLSDLGSHGFIGLSVSPCQINYLVYVYGLWTSNHRVVWSLHKLCSASSSVKTFFFNPLNGINHPVLVDSEKYKEGRKLPFPKPKKESK